MWCDTQDLFELIPINADGARRMVGGYIEFCDKRWGGQAVS